MANPRFEDDAIAPLHQPDIKQIMCKNCTWKEADRLNGQIKGATLGVCQVYEIKPYGILWKNDHCPYYVEE